jgi:outer membrane biosynthesis protein TonB
VTNTSMRTVADLQALDQPTQGLITADYPASAHTQMSAGVTQLASNGHVAPLGYSEVPDDDPLGSEYGYDELPDPDAGEPDSAHRLFPLAGSALALILAVGAVALVISLAVGVHPTGEQLPSSGEAATVPNSQPAVPAAPEVPQPPPSPSGADTIREPAPVAPQAPQTVYTPRVQQAPAAVATPPASPAPPPEDIEPPMDADPASQVGDSAGQVGDSASQDGDSAGQEGDLAGQDGDSAGQEGDSAGQEGDLAGQEGDLAGQEGDLAGQGGDSDGQGGDSADMGRLPGLSRVPEDPRLSTAGTPIIMAPKHSLRPSSE